MSNEVLFKPNQLIRSVLDVNSNDYKIFNLALQKTQLKLYKEKDVDNKLIPVILYLDEIKGIYKNNTENRLTDVLKTLEKLCKVPIKWKNKDRIIISTLFSSVEIDSKNINIIAYIDIKVVKVLYQYQEKGYTPINLGLTKKANGFYSVRLYELLRSWCNKKKNIEISLAELKSTLAISNIKSYNNFANFRIKVIDKAIEEIKEKMNMEITYEVTKEYRKVNTIIFKVLDHEPRTYDFRKSKNLKDKKAEKVRENLSVYDIDSIYLRLLSNNVKISPNTLKSKKKEYGETIFIRGIKILENKTKEEKIKAPVRYLTGVLENLKSEEIRLNISQESIRKNTFANFNERSYNMNKLEKALLGYEDIDIDNLYE